MKNGSDNGRAPAGPAADALDVVTVAVITGAINARAALHQAFPANKRPAYKKTRARFRSLKRECAMFDRALQAIEILEMHPQDKPHQQPSVPLSGNGHAAVDSLLI